MPFGLIKAVCGCDVLRAYRTNRFAMQASKQVVKLARGAGSGVATELGRRVCLPCAIQQSCKYESKNNADAQPDEPHSSHSLLGRSLVFSATA